MDYSDASRIAQLPPRGKTPRRITGSQAEKASKFALSDIRKLIVGRHGGSTYDPAWTHRYLEAALPHIIATRRAWGEAVRAWVLQHVPILAIMEGDDWIDEQAAACANRGKSRGRRRNENDRIAKLLGITGEEVKAYGLRALQAAKRTKAVRQRERSEAKAAKKREARKQAGANPHAESARKLKPWKAEGISKSTYYNRKSKENRLSAMTCEEKTSASDHFGPNIRKASDHVTGSCENEAASDHFGPNIPVCAPKGDSGPFRPQHSFKRENHAHEWKSIFQTLTENAQDARDAYGLEDNEFARLARMEQTERMAA